MVYPRIAKGLCSACCATLLVSTLAGCSNLVDAMRMSLVSLSVTEGIAAQHAQRAQTQSAPTFTTDGVLTVGVRTTAATPLIQQQQDGTFRGYDVDVASALADQLGVSVTFVPVDGTRSSASSTCDILMDESSRPSTGKSSDSSADPATSGSTQLNTVGSYAQSATAFFHKGSAQTVDRKEIVDKKVGVQADSRSEKYLERSDLSVKAQTYITIDEAFKDLETGSVDYVLCDALSGQYAANTYSDIALAGTIDTPTAISIGVSSSRDDMQNAISQALQSLSSGGVLDVIQTKWFGSTITLSDASQVQGITLSSSSSSASTGIVSETVSAAHGTSGTQDGSSAGANAANFGGK